MSILIVIVLYKQQIEESVGYNSLLASLRLVSIDAAVLLYDNSPRSQNEVSEPGIDISYYHNPNNPGVSAAYNFAAARANEKQKKWLMLLDQDTDIDIHFFKKLLASITDYPHLKLFAPILVSNKIDDYILSPCRLFLYRGFRMKKVVSGVQPFKGKTIINSGAVVNLDEFFKVGGFNEAIKLDFSDFDFFYRLGKRQKEFFLVDSTFRHDLSVIDASVDSLLARHFYYVMGASYFPQNFKQYLGLSVVSFYRSFYLALKLKDTRFLGIFLTNYKKRYG